MSDLYIHCSVIVLMCVKRRLEYAIAACTGIPPAIGGAASMQLMWKLRHSVNQKSPEGLYVWARQGSNLRPLRCQRSALTN